MRTLLVIDDEPELGAIIEGIFAKRGWRVVQLGDGAHAHAAAIAESPDAVLLDLNLPEMSGFDVCRALKTDPRTQGIPILMMTASHVAREDAELGFEFGADEYMVKPFVRQILVHNVERLVAQH